AAGAQGGSLPADVQVALIAKIMRFDRHLDRYGREVVLGILYQGGNRESGRTARDVGDVARSVQVIGAGNQAFRPVLIEYASGMDLKAELKKRGVSLLYLSSMRAVDLARLVEQAHEMGVLTIAAEAEPIQAGVAIGLQERGPRPAVSIRLSSARKAGSDLDSRLLHLADVQP
ncbi:MAG TPA: YfiR family protein, partial [Longimicrobiales bacterium]